MWHPVIAYIKYIISAKTKYNIHSPFVYDLITKGLEIQINSKNKIKLKNYRRTLLRNKNTIKVQDFGAGSRVFKSNKRKVSTIAKIAGINSKKADLLQHICHYFKPNTILEIGTSLGIGTAALHIASPNALITSIEGCSETAKTADKHLKKQNFKNITIKVGEFSSLLPNLVENNRYDLIYFDGNHQEKATKDYFITTLKSVHNDTICIFDDIHWSSEMEKAWDFLKKHPKTKVSIDLFHFGLIFFRKEQEKQDFIIKHKH